MSIKKNILHRAIWSSLARTLGVGVAAGAGSLLHQLVGDGAKGYFVAFAMGLASFTLMVLSEYNKETVSSSSEPASGQASLISDNPKSTAGEPAP